VRLLAFDCATERLSVALWQDGTCLSREAPGAREHARLLLPFANELLAEAGLSLNALDGIAFGRGPGSFTGLRIAAAAAQGLAFGADLPLAPVSTLLALAHCAGRLHGAGKVLPVLDARMQAVYCCAAERRGDVWVMSAPELVCAPDRMSVPADAGWFGAGPGWSVYASVLTPRFLVCLTGQDASLLPQAEDIATLGALQLRRGEGVDAALAQPGYLRDDVIQVKNAAAE
jgi:tRNA threonylcarbamoyladenosine biosynthesis protein TsaB